MGNRGPADDPPEQARQVRRAHCYVGRKLLDGPGVPDVVVHHAERLHDRGRCAHKTCGVRELRLIKAVRKPQEKKQEVGNLVGMRVFGRRIGQVVQDPGARIEAGGRELDVDDAVICARSGPEQEAEPWLLGEPEKLAVEQPSLKAAVDHVEAVAVFEGVPGPRADCERVAAIQPAPVVQRPVQAPTSDHDDDLDEVMIVRGVPAVQDVMIDIDLAPWGGRQRRPLQPVRDHVERRRSNDRIMLVPERARLAIPLFPS